MSFLQCVKTMWTTILVGIFPWHVLLHPALSFTTNDFLFAFFL